MRLLFSRIINSSLVFPYQLYLRTKIIGLAGVLIFKLRLKFPRPDLSDEKSNSRLKIKLTDTKRLRDIYLNMDQLPTIRTGLQALGVDSVFDTFSRNVSQINSKYTHPLQRPAFYIPGVPAQTFYDPAQFEWANPLEQAFPVIKGELLNLLNKPQQSFNTYRNEYGVLVPGWNTFLFYFFGEKWEENCALCPETTRILESLPRFEKELTMFSAMNPHSVISPHHGPMNGAIRALLPLVVPGKCGIKAGEDERPLVEGKLLTFDDSFRHQAWNKSDEIRIVLFLNFWHPCFSEQEIAVLEEFRNAYQSLPQIAQIANYHRESKNSDIVLDH